MLRALLFVVAASSAASGWAHDFVSFLVEPQSPPSLFRVAGGPWQSTEGSFDVNGTAGGFSLSWLLGEARAFDLRPGCAPWFSTHVVTDAMLAGDPVVLTIGERVGGVQSFSYGGPTVGLPVVEVPEPSAGLLAFVAAATAVAFILWSQRHGEKCDGDGEDARGAARVGASADGRRGRSGLDEQRLRVGDRGEVG